MRPSIWRMCPPPPHEPELIVPQLGWRLLTCLTWSVSATVPTPPAQLFSVAGGRAQPAGQLWLRAATIAVPIAGLFILAFLVLLAVRMLRRETKPQYQYAKAPLCLEPAPTRASEAAGAAVAERVGAAGAAVTGRVGATPAPCHPGAPVHCVWRSDT